MAELGQKDGEKASVQAAVNAFHESLSEKPPFTNVSRFVVPDAISVGLIMGDLHVETFTTMYKRSGEKIAEVYSSGVKNFEHRSAEPEPEVWTSGNLAVDFRGYAGYFDGQKMIHGVSIHTLHQFTGKSDVEGNPWRISGLTTLSQLAQGLPSPVIETGPVPEITAPFKTFLAHAKARDWEAIVPLLLPGGGATISRGSESPVGLTWPAYIQQLKDEAESKPSAVFEKTLGDCEVRRYKDIAFVWAPFKLLVDGAEQAQGVNVCTFSKKEEGKWLIGGIQEASSST
ncbi:hypothetical protein GQ53DRAFT_850672 [Thozetella sp. PMI_491]|nr:hypothetical protein GQ53DRAFT_850672 [Thozetella sp. PMI_491]